MESKARSKPMREILDRLLKEFEVVIFGDKCILDEDITVWPLCDIFISFYSKSFPLTKAIDYVNLRRPICINDLLMQPLLWDRRLILQILDKEGIPTPQRITSNVGNDYPDFTVEMLQKIADMGIQLDQVPNIVTQIDSETIQLGSKILKKPFVEKPVSGDDHNVYLYYSKSQGGGVRKMFRKVGNQSSLYCPDEWKIRSGASFIYEEFLESTNLEDVKVYTVGEDFVHAETRKSPVVDGLVRRNANGKEIRYVISLSDKELEIGKSVARIFKQAICGFDLLRTDDRSFVIDVNGWSFVKGNEFYNEQCAHILKRLFLEKAKEKGDISELTVNPEPWKLKGFFSVMRHGDRTPKQKMKFIFTTKVFFSFLGDSLEEVLIKRPENIQLVLDACNKAELEGIEDPNSLLQLKMILQAKMLLPGTKIQLKPTIKNGQAQSIQCIVKWGGEFTHSGLYHSRDLAQNLRKDLSIINKGLLDDIKIFTSSERRVIATADTFCKAFLNTHDIPPDFIMVSKEMLDDSNSAKDSMRLVKDKLRDILNPDTETKLPKDIVIPVEMENPAAALKELIDLLSQLRVIMRTNYDRLEVMKLQTRWCCSESPFLFKERWEKLFRDFCDVEVTQFDTSKISELHDSLKYDFLHNRSFMQVIFKSDNSETEILRKVYKKSQVFFACFGPHEYGISNREKLDIGIMNSLHLLNQLIEEITLARDSDRPCSRFFFTKESKIMCLLNIVLLCGLKCHVTPTEIRELDYLTQIVFELYERKGVENEYSLRIEFSPGAHYWNLIDLELDSKHALSAAPRFFISDHIPLEEAMSHLRPKLMASESIKPVSIGRVDDDGLFQSISPDTVRRHTMTQEK